MLPQLAERLFVDAHLFKDPIEKRRSDFPSTMKRNRGRAAVIMNPSFMTARLSRKMETKFRGDTTEIRRTSARHERFQWYREA